MVLMADGGGFNAAAARAAAEAARKAAAEAARKAAEEAARKAAAEAARKAAEEAARKAAAESARKTATEAPKAPAREPSPPSKGTGNLAKAAEALRAGGDSPLPWDDAPAAKPEASEGGFLSSITGKVKNAFQALKAEQAAGNYTCAAQRVNEAFAGKAPEQYAAFQDDLTAGKPVNVNGKVVSVSEENRKAIAADDALDAPGKAQALADTAMMEYAASAKDGTYDYASGETRVPGEDAVKGLDQAMMKKLDDFGFTKTFDADAERTSAVIQANQERNQLRRMGEEELALGVDADAYYAESVAAAQKEAQGNGVTLTVAVNESADSEQAHAYELKVELPTQPEGEIKISLDDGKGHEEVSVGDLLERAADGASDIGDDTAVATGYVATNRVGIRRR